MDRLSILEKKYALSSSFFDLIPYIVELRRSGFEEEVTEYSTREWTRIYWQAVKADENEDLRIDLIYQFISLLHVAAKCNSQCIYNQEFCLCLFGGGCLMNEWLPDNPNFHKCKFKSRPHGGQPAVEIKKNKHGLNLFCGECDPGGIVEGGDYRPKNEFNVVPGGVTDGIMFVKKHFFHSVYLPESYEEDDEEDDDEREWRNYLSEQDGF